MILKTRIHFDEYLKLMFTLTYRKRATIYISVIGAIMVIATIFNYKLLQSGKVSVWPVILGFSTIIVLPLSVYWSARKNYAANKRMQEQIIYEFSDGEMKLTGESFNSELVLATSYKIEELKHWFMIYQSPQVANLIPKTNMSENEVSELRALLRTVDGVQLKLK